MEYESVVKEIKVLKSTLRDVKNENKTVKEQYSQLKVSYESLQAEMEQLKFESHSLSNLRAEHSKLKVKKLVGLGALGIWVTRLLYGEGWYQSIIKLI
jgi:hypothetical protein